MMTTQGKIELLQTLLIPESIISESRFHHVLEQIGALKKDYGDYMTTTPIYVDFELKRTKKANYDLCCALITMILREDHFSNGSFIKRYQSGEVERIIRRMIFLLNEEEEGCSEGPEWISEYEDYSNQSLYGKVRYLLGTKGERPLVVVGVNPSSAVPECPDQTIRVVSNRVQEDDRFDSFMMINLCPQRAVKPRDLHKEIDFGLHEKNCKHIHQFLSSLGKKEIVVWAAWGGTIDQRNYLKDCLSGIVNLTDAFSCEWVQCGKFKNPHHPLYLPQGTAFQPFDVREYLRRKTQK